MMEERGAGLFETITSTGRSGKNSDWVLSQKNLAKNEIFVHFIQIWKF